MSNPGGLNRRLTLEQPVEIPDGAGGVTRSFEAVATWWAQVTPLSAREMLDAGRLGIAVTHRIVVRAGPDIGVRHRLREGGRIYRIVSVRPVGERETFREIVAQEQN